MLVLNRKEEEELIIETPEGPVIIRLLNIDGKSVKLGIEAPKKYLILRKELYDRIYQENVESMNEVPLDVLKQLMKKKGSKDE